MNEFDPALIQLLRKMAHEGCSVAEMARRILPKMSFPGGQAIEVLRYFQEAFCLTLAQAKPVADSVVYDKAASSDMDLQRWVWPYIDLNQGCWKEKMVG